MAEHTEQDYVVVARNLATAVRVHRELLGALRELCNEWAKRAATRVSGSDSYRKGALDAWNTAVEELGAELAVNRRVETHG